MLGLVLLGAGLGFHALLEGWGGRWPFLAVVFIGIVPVMAGAIIGAANNADNRLLTLGTWLAGISPAAAAVYAAQILLPAYELPAEISRAVPRAFWFWQAVTTLAVIWLVTRLWQIRKSRAKAVNQPETVND
jgi:hypothetical protein